MMQRWFRRARRWRAPAAVLIAAVAITACASEQRQEAAAGEGECSVLAASKPGRSDRQSLTDRPATQAILKSNSQDTRIVELGRSRTHRVFDVQLESQTPHEAHTPIQVALTGFDLPTSSLRSGITVRAWFDTNRVVNLWACVEPKGASPGIYKGNVIVDDLAFARVSVPVELHLQERPLIKPVAIVTLAAAGGAWWQSILAGLAVSAKEVELRRRRVNPDRARGWMTYRHRELALAAVAGVGSAAGVLTTRYVNDSGWDGSLGAYVSLAMAAGTAAAAAATGMAGLVYSRMPRDGAVEEGVSHVGA